MSKPKVLIVILVLLRRLLAACRNNDRSILTRPGETPAEVLAHLKAGNKAYIAAKANPAKISEERRTETADYGQKPYAVVITCSDSRVPPEHIFSAGIGDLFVIRTAGNVVGDYELGTIEYGVIHLGVKVVVVLGHSDCGAVAATIEGHAGGKIWKIVDEIHRAIGDEKDIVRAEALNIAQGKKRVMESEIITCHVAEGRLEVIEAKYDIHTGEVTFVENGE